VVATVLTPVVSWEMTVESVSLAASTAAHGARAHCSGWTDPSATHRLTSSELLHGVCRPAWLRAAARHAKDTLPAKKSEASGRSPRMRSKSSGMARASKESRVATAICQDAERFKKRCAAMSDDP
jgi:hypothetical protein